MTSPLSGTERGTGGEDPACKPGDQAVRRQLCPAQRAVDPLTSERVEEIGGVADEQGTIHRGPPGPLAEWSGGEHVANEAAPLEPSGERRIALELGEEAGPEILPASPHCGAGNDERHRRHAPADRPQAHVPALAYVQLPHAVHARDVGGERDPSRR